MYSEITEEVISEIFKLVLEKRDTFSKDDLEFDTDPTWNFYSIEHGLITDDSFSGFLKLCGTESTLIDIGANRGYSFTSFHNLGHIGKYIAIEPMPQHIPALKALKSAFKRFSYWSGAVGIECNQREICVPSFQKRACSSLAFMDMKEDFLKTTLFYLIPKELESWNLSDIGLNWFQVATRTLDCLVSTGEIVIDGLIGGIKIDVEDLEYEVLEGARKTIKKHRPPLHIEGASKRKRVANILTELNYQYVELDETGRIIRLRNMDELTNEINGTFVHASTPDVLKLNQNYPEL